MTQALNLANFANYLNSSGKTSNSGLQNSTVTVVAGTGLSGGGTSSLGGSVTLNNTGVTSVGAGTGISVSSSTGGVTITNTSPNQLSTTSGSAPYTGARAWVNFSGVGGVSINTSFNVSSVVRNATGNYTVNMLVPMPDANYAVVGCCNVYGAAASLLNIYNDGYSDYYYPSNSSFTFTTMYNTNAGGISDANVAMVSVFR